VRSADHAEGHARRRQQEITPTGIEAGGGEATTADRRQSAREKAKT